MPITVSQKDYARAVGCCADTVCRRLRSVPYAGGARSRRYYVAAVLPTLTARERGNGAIQRLFDIATSDGTLFVGDEVIPVCRAFEDWLDTEQKERLTECRVNFTAALFEATSSSEIWQFVDALHLKLCLHPSICRFVVTGDDTELPDIDASFAFAFSLCNARHFENLTNKEAA
ncbi:hypothetical protein [Ruegeria sp. Ofav3-42]|uniref:hypothetical protein n=1 Tax=Ruegeria sp. Ofav3-42 TaxID=2917759 RepID=UPI001EF626F4|nr:hypothetical protein [Ruegeria sp. Ofav3-42]MCG7518449.1 hypothetical protein [Ruegeria sp. Ofav3-42]